MPEQIKEFWHVLWPAIAASISTLALAYAIVVTPLNDRINKIESHIEFNDRQLVDLFKFEGSDQQWNTSHDQEIIQLRADLSAAYIDREKKIDRINNRLDALELRILERK